MGITKIIASAGTWYCETCRKSMATLYKANTGESYCETCLPDTAKILKIVNQNRDVVKDV